MRRERRKSIAESILGARHPASPSKLDASRSPALLAGWVLKLKQPKERLIDRVGGAWSRRWFEVREVDSPAGDGTEWALCQTRQKLLGKSKKRSPESCVYLRHIEAVRPASGHPSFSVGDAHSQHLQHPKHVERNRAEMREHSRASIEIVAHHCSLFLRFEGAPSERLSWCTALAHLAGLRAEDNNMEQRDFDEAWGRGRACTLPPVPHRIRKLREESGPVALLPREDESLENLGIYRGPRGERSRTPVAESVRDGGGGADRSSISRRRRGSGGGGRGRGRREREQPRDSEQQGGSLRSSSSSRRNEERSGSGSERTRTPERQQRQRSSEGRGRDGRQRERDAPTDDRGDRSPAPARRSISESSPSTRTPTRSSTSAPRTPIRASRRPIDTVSDQQAPVHDDEEEEEEEEHVIDAEDMDPPRVVRSKGRASSSDDEKVADMLIVTAAVGAAMPEGHRIDGVLLDDSSDVVSMDDDEFMAQVGGGKGKGKSEWRGGDRPTPAVESSQDGTHMRSISFQEGRHQEAPTPDSKIESESSDWDAEVVDRPRSSTPRHERRASPATNDAPATRRSRSPNATAAAKEVDAAEEHNHDEWDDSSDGDVGRGPAGADVATSLGSASVRSPSGHASSGTFDNWDDDSDASPLHRDRAAAK